MAKKDTKKPKMIDKKSFTIIKTLYDNDTCVLSASGDFEAHELYGILHSVMKDVDASFNSK